MPRLAKWASQEWVGDEWADEQWSDTEDQPKIDDICAAANNFLDLITTLYFKGVLSATNVRQLCDGASKANAAEPIGKFGKPAGLSTGKYQRHLDAALGIDTRDTQRFNFIKVPKYLKASRSREVVPTPVLVPHKELHEEIVKTPSRYDELAEVVR